MGAEVFSMLGAIVVAAIAFVTGRRIKSGHVQTSEAAELWTAAEKLREEGRRDRADLRLEINELRAMVDEQEKELKALRVENRKVDSENFALTRKVSVLEYDNSELTRQVGLLRERILQLEARNVGGVGGR